MAVQIGEESFAEVYKKKVEQNKRKLEQIRLLNKPDSAHSLLQKSAAVISVSVSAASLKPAKRKAPVQDATFINKKAGKEKTEVIQKPTKVVKTKPRDFSDRVLASNEARATAKKKAQNVEKILGAKYPTFVKPMLKSHTTGGFWLGLPITFCRKHLPDVDSTIILIDEEGNESNTTYLTVKTGLSGGWRGFSMKHKLADGDALVFQLVKKTKFKIYITRAQK